MKFLISVLLFPTLLVILLAFGCYCFYRYGITNPLSAGGETSDAHLLKAFLHMSMGIGLPLSILSFVSGCILTVVSLVFKSWTRAAFSGGIAAAGMYFWLYFMNAPLPF